MLTQLLSLYSDFRPYKDQIRSAISDPGIRHEIQESARYLLIDELGLFGYATILDLLKNFAYENLVSPDWPYRDRGHLAITIGAREYLNYLFTIVPRSQTKGADETLFFDAVFSHNLPMVQDIVQKRRIDPVTAEFTRSALLYYDWMTQLGFLKREEFDGTSQSLLAAITAEDIKITEWLLEDPKIHDDYDNSLGLALRRTNLPICRLLLDHFDYTLNLTYLVRVIFSENLEVKFSRAVLKHVLDDSRYRTEAVSSILFEVQAEQVKPYLQDLDPALISELMDVYHKDNDDMRLRFDTPYSMEVIRILRALV